MKGKITIIAIVLLTVLNLLSLIYSSQSKSEIESLKDSVNNKTNKVVVYQGQDGYTPVKGKDYFDGAAGVNSMSYSISNTVVKEVPLVGERGPAGENGINGLDAPVQEIRINPDTGDLESKLTGYKFWQTLVSCNQLQVGCPNAQ